MTDEEHAKLKNIDEQAYNDTAMIRDLLGGGYDVAIRLIDDYREMYGKGGLSVKGDYMPTNEGRQGVLL